MILANKKLVQKSEKLTILYLYAELMGYQIPILQEYVKKYNAQVHIVHWDKKKLTPYKPPKLENVFYYKKSDYNKYHLIKLASGLKPDIAFISGWMDRDYLYVAKLLRKLCIPVVSGFDDQWEGNLRQKVASLISPYILRRYFSHGWVTGPYQYEFAREMGFKKNEIIFNCYSADVNLFNSTYLKYKNQKVQKYPHRFLYAGRFEHIKGIDLLVNAWVNISDRRKDWDLCFIGNGHLESYLLKQKDIIVKDFMQPDELIKEIEGSGCFVLPSRKEPWAIVLHEFAAAGLPIICSDICGAGPVFVTSIFNGYIFKSNEVKSLEAQMLKIINLSDQELVQMSQNSHISGQKINPEISAASFLSILDL